MNCLSKVPHGTPSPCIGPFARLRRSNASAPRGICGTARKRGIWYDGAAETVWLTFQRDFGIDAVLSREHHEPQRIHAFRGLYVDAAKDVSKVIAVSASLMGQGFSMKSRFLFSMLTLSLPLLLAACDGEMQGIVEGSGERPKIQYQQGIDHDLLTITMPDGEVFDGKLVAANQRTTVTNIFVENLSGFGLGTTSDGKFAGKLFSNRSRVMNCLMQYSDSSGFTTSGGIGECQIVGGPKIDVLW